jgi:hypothetical protein
MARRETYSTTIEPIVDRILAICEESDMPCVIVFQLNEDRPSASADLAVVCVTAATMSSRFTAAFNALGVVALVEPGPEFRTLDREAVYDNQVFPLMGEIIDLCKEHDIPLLASFQYDDRSDPEDSSACTTFDRKADCAPCMKIACDLIVNGYSAYTVTRRP